MKATSLAAPSHRVGGKRPPIGPVRTPDRGSLRGQIEGQCQCLADLAQHDGPTFPRTPLTRPVETARTCWHGAADRTSSPFEPSASIATSEGREW